MESYKGLMITTNLTYHLKTHSAKYVRNRTPSIESPCSPVEEQPADKSRDQIGYTQGQDESHKYVGTDEKKIETKTKI